MFLVNTSENFETILASKHPVKRKSEEPSQLDTNNNTQGCF